jgi:hypothetical protein
MKPSLSLLLAAFALSSCTCQRPENVEARERMSKPAPPDPSVAAASEPIDAEGLVDALLFKRVSRMDGAEIAARLGAFTFTSTADLELGRDVEGQGLRSSEKTRVLQAKSGDFGVEVTTGDGSEMRLAYVNDVFFLKNNNGRWRMSRDPAGERNAYRSDALGVWRAFYDLYAHALRVEKSGSGTHAGRSVIKYRLSVPDQSAEAIAEGAKLPAPPSPPSTLDGAVEVPEEPAADKRKRLRDRMAQWRSRAKPAGGAGELWVDVTTGVPLLVRFEGRLAIGDQPNPARLRVKLEQSYTRVGEDPKVTAPKDAIEEVVRQKMPVRPRALLEEEYYSASSTRLLNLPSFFVVTQFMTYLPVGDLL